MYRLVTSADTLLFQSMDWMKWPARFPDLNPLYLFLWDHLRSIIYEIPIEDETDLTQIQRIINGFQQVRKIIEIF